METQIELTTSTKFSLSHEEKKRFYTAMALLQYKYECIPDYNEVALRRRLRNDFQRFNLEIIKVQEKDPNNLILSQVRNFFQHHYGNVKLVVQQENSEELQEG